MIRTKAGRPRRADPGVRHRTRWRSAVTRTVARAPNRRFRRAEARRPGLCRQWLRRVLALGLPTAWGGAAILYKLVCPLAQQNGLGARIVTCAVFFAFGTGLILYARRGLLRELRQIRRVAGAAQSVLLRPLPPRVDGLGVAVAQLSADRGACVGGDLYEVIGTEYGVRVVMGDVRGHGPAAIGTVAAVLGSFREAVHDESELADVLRTLERAMDRHLRERAKTGNPLSGLDPDSPVAEEFVTVLLLEIGGDGEMRALNCGHPWPYLLRAEDGDPAGQQGRAEEPDRAGARRRVEHLALGDPMPPLGPFPLPAELDVFRCGRLRPGEALFLHTDGVEDARDADGRFFPLAAALTEATRTRPTCPQAVLRTVFNQLLDHAGGLPKDDVALLVLRNDRSEVPSSQVENLAHQGTSC